MLTIHYTASFVRQYDNLLLAMQEEVRDRIALFQTDPRQPSLHMHKLKGNLRNKWSFRVNYRYRVVFCYDSKNVIALLAVGDHGVYG